jgi:hypothetical protein
LIREAQIASVALGIVLAGSAALYAAEPTATSFVALKFEGTCDAQNNRLWLSNTHTFKTIVTTVRWRAAGGKDLVEQFFPAPNSQREIGCAAEGEIVEAKFAEF